MSDDRDSWDPWGKSLEDPFAQPLPLPLDGETVTSNTVNHTDDVDDIDISTSASSTSSTFASSGSTPFASSKSSRTSHSAQSEFYLSQSQGQPKSVSKDEDEPSDDEEVKSPVSPPQSSPSVDFVTSNRSLDSRAVNSVARASIASALESSPVKIFTDFRTSHQKPWGDFNDGGFSGLQSASAKPVVVITKAQARASALLVENAAEPTFGVFATASKKSVTINATNLARATAMLGEITDDQLLTPAPKSEPLAIKTGGGFATAGGSAVTVKPTSLARVAAMNIFDDFASPTPTDTNSTPKFEGFSTGKGTKVTISERGAQYATRFAADMDKGFAAECSKDTGASSVFTGVTTGSGAKEVVPERGAQLARSFLAEMNDDVAAEPVSNSSADMPAFQGFSTGKGAKLAISERAAQFARSFAADMAEDYSTVPATIPSASCTFEGFSTGKGNRVAMSERAAQFARNFAADMANDFAGGQPIESSPSLAPPVSTAKPFESLSAIAARKRQPPASLLRSAKPALLSAATNRLKPPVTPLNDHANKRRKLTFNSPRPVPKPPQSIVKTTKTKVVDDKSKLDLSPVPPIALTLTLPTTSFSAATIPARSFTDTELLSLGVSPSVIVMTSITAAAYRFTVNSVDYGPSSMLASLIAIGCDVRLLSNAWINNHWRWIVWKLACLERRHPHSLANRCLTWCHVLRQMKRRYDRELDQCQRSAIKIILERDESTSRYMVLTVASVRNDWTSNCDDGSQPSSPLLQHCTDLSSQCHIELTDGWYGIAAKLDADLLSALNRRRITVGTKLRIFNARLEGDENATTPLENHSTYLAISVNSVRRGTDGLKMGFQKSSVFPVSVLSLKPGGGCAPMLYGYVRRVYPMHYMETITVTNASTDTDADSAEAQQTSKVTRNEAAELRQHELYVKECERRMEAWQTQTENQLHRQYTGMEDEDELQRRINAINSDDRGPEMPEPRAVVPFLKFQFTEATPPAAAPLNDTEQWHESGANHCVVTVWRPSEHDIEMLVEGSLIAIVSPAVQHRRNNMLALTLAKSAPILSLNVHRDSAVPRPLTVHAIDALTADTEFDCIAILVNVTQSHFNANELQLFAYDLSSSQLIFVKCPNDDRSLFPSLTGALTPCVREMKNLSFVHYDAKLHVYQTQASMTTVFNASVSHSVKRRKATGSASNGGGSESGDSERHERISELQYCLSTAAHHRVNDLQEQRVRVIQSGDDNAAIAMIDAIDEALANWKTKLDSVLASADVQGVGDATTGTSVVGVGGGRRRRPGGNLLR